MSAIIARASWLFFAVGCGGNDNNSNPPTIIPTASCLLAVSILHDYDPAQPSTGPYECAGYDENAYPVAMRPWETTEGFNVDEPIAGCNGSTHFAWPACSLVGMATGVAYRPGHEGAHTGDDDGDWSMDLCPEFQEVVPGVVSPFAMELRNQGAFNTAADNENANVGPNGYLGSLHVEVQDCLFYRGFYTASNGTTVGSAPQDGDYVAAFGEWIADDGHQQWDLGGVDSEHPEIHEATALAVVKPEPLGDPRSPSYDAKQQLIFASGFFTNRAIQPNEMFLDVRTPSPGPTATMLSCAALDLPQTPTCTDYGTAGITVTPSVVQPGNMCHVFALRDPTVDGAPPLVDYGCWGPTGQCHQALFGLGACDSRIHFAKAFRSTWDPPADLWLCHCDAPDPATDGRTLIPVIAQGCSSGPDEATACSEVCGQGGQVCDDLAEPACYLGNNEPGSTLSGQMVGPKACDPDEPFNFRSHVSQNADYVATLSGQVQITQGDDSISEPVRATVYFDVVKNGTTIEAIDMADVIGRILDFSIDGTDVTEASIFIGARQVGLFDDADDASHFRVPAGLGVYGLRAKIDGNLQGLNLSNADGFDMSGHVDLHARTFSLHISGRDPKSGGAVVADASGAITNVPPHADASKTQKRVECTSHTTTPIILDGTASSDPDGEPIAHYQWFRLAGGSPVSISSGNAAVVQTALRVGVPTTYQLHAYDSKLGADETTATVSVVDTLPPSLDLSPLAFCAWPPNHQFVCYRLGRDIAVTADDTCDPDPVVRIRSVTSDQPTLGPKQGAGHTSNDVTWNDEEFCVRAERAATLGPRAYTATIEVVDQSGNATSQDVHVTVPEDGASRCATSTGGSRSTSPIAGERSQ